jgi:hypothetical protein
MGTLKPQRLRPLRTQNYLSSIPALSGSPMNLIRSRAHNLIDRLSNEELETLWTVLEPLYYDLYMLRAIQAAKHAHKPGDTLTREEATQLLPLLQSAPRTL